MHDFRPLSEASQGERVERSHSLDAAELRRLWERVLSAKPGPKLDEVGAPEKDAPQQLQEASDDDDDSFVELPAKRPLECCACDDAATRGVIADVVAEVAPFEGYEELCSKCLKDLEQLCRDALSVPEFRVAPFDWTPEPRLEPFGSLLQGTAIHSSDLDVRMSFTQFSVLRRERQLEYLEGIARGVANSSFEVVILIAAAALPILQLRYEGKLDVDLSMGEAMTTGAVVDKTVSDLLDAAESPGPRRLVQLVKAFAKKHKLLGAHMCFLNSISWVLLALTFLQMEGALPLHEDLELPNRPRLWAIEITQDLIYRFFVFMVELGNEQLVDVTRSRQSGAPAPSEMQGALKPLTITHPGLPGRNISQCLSRRNWDVTLWSCKWARDHCARGGSAFWDIFVDGPEPCEKRRRLQDVGSLERASVW